MLLNKNNTLYNLSTSKCFSTFKNVSQTFLNKCPSRVVFTKIKEHDKSILKNLIINIFLLREYAAFFIFVSVCFVLSILLYTIAKNINKEMFYNEKSAPYECGFEAFSDARGRINIHFYVVALLFVIFDVEVIYFLPWAVNFYSLGFAGYFAMIIFNGFLVFGFIYEWSRGVFNWAKPQADTKKEK